MLTKRTILGEFLRARWRAAALLATIGLTNGFVTLLLPLSLGRFYELQFGGGTNRGRVLDSLGFPGGTGWAAFFALFVGLILAKGLLEFAETYAAGHLSEQFAQSLRERLFARQLAVPLTTHRRKAASKYLLRYGGDLRSLRRYLTRGVVLFASDVVFVGLALALLAWLNGPLTAALAGMLLPFLIVFRFVNHRLEAASRARRDVRSANLAFVASRLTNLATVKVFNIGLRETERFNRRSARLSALNRGYLRWQSARQALLPMAVYALVATVLGTVAYLGTGTDTALLLTYVLLVLSLRPVLRRLLRVGSVWRSGNLSFAKLTALLAEPTEAETAGGTYEYGAGELRFEQVSFQHDAARPVLRDLSFVARPGTVTQLVGVPGAGKSTVLDLILKLHEPTAGTVRLDGQDLTTCSAHSVRRSVTLVGEGVPLLGRTVFEAVTYRRSDEKRPRAARLLHQVQDCVRPRYHLTLDDPIGDDGALLSAGQRRVLQWVRALMTNKPVLLLDEPFAGLSPAAAERLGALLRERRPKSTILLVSEIEVPGLLVDQTIRLIGGATDFVSPEMHSTPEPA